MQKRKRIIAIVSAIAVMVSAFMVFAATKYPNALVYFSGIDMVTNGSTTQGFVDITLKNINTTGLSFCLEYDKTYVELSDVSDNSVIQNVPASGIGASLPNSTFNIEHKFFEQNTADFPNGVFRDVQISSNIGANMPIIGIADPNNGHLLMNFLPVEGASSVCNYIEDMEYDNQISPTIMAADKGDLRLGRISFKILDPSVFSKLTPSQLEEVIKIIPFSNMIQTDDSMSADDEGIHISYVDENEDIKWYSRSQQYIDYKFDINAVLSDVLPKYGSLSVSSYEIFKDGTKQDLLDFLNERMSMLNLVYSDSSLVPAVFEWNADKSNLNSITWDPKGGDYTITQQYNDEFSISVTVHVEPVNLTGFSVENENKTYWKDSPDFPSLFGQLELPRVAKPVFDQYIPNGGIADVNISWYALEGTSSGITELPKDFGDVDATYTFIAYLEESEQSLSEKYKWLTVNSPLPTLKMKRSVVLNKSDLPKTLVVESDVTDSNGVLSIVLANDDGSEIPDGTSFNIRMPDGELVDTSAMGPRYSVTITDGKATIVLSPDITLVNEKKLAQYINLGNRSGGSFAIAAKEDSSPETSYTEFAPEPRYNYYTGTNYTFDYSTSLSAMFQVKAGTSLPTTITLPMATDRIYTTYSGYTGDVPGELETFTVDSWNVISGDKDTPGSTVTVEGTLSNSYYTNYGQVVNNQATTVTIKYYVVEATETDGIDTIPDAVYDTQQQGYGYDKLQTKSFTIKNLGQHEIYGLSVNISLSDPDDLGEKHDAFVLSKAPVPMLAGGESETFDITTKIGLPAGTYTCDVSVMSNNDTLQTFKVTFVVTQNPVYNIKIVIDDAEKDFGKAKTLSETYTAEEGSVITIVATPEEDCKFTGWTTNYGDISFDDPSAASTTFTMPGSDVEIRANFKETLGAKLRATELYIKDTNGVDQTLNDKDWHNITFDSVTREYYVAVPNATDKVKLWFKLRTEAENATLVLTKDNGTTTDTLAAPVKDTGDGHYDTQDIDLEVSPVDNLVTLSMTYNDPTDDPDEGSVTRTYKIHVYRKLSLADLMQFNPGNSPYGLIMSDSSIADSDKAAVKQAFVDNNYTFTAGNTPSGGTVGTEYLIKAWSGANYDLSDSALFVNNASAFSDPGYSSVVNSIGKPVTSDITKSITITKLEESVVSMMDGSSDDFVYTSQKTLTLPASGQISELTSERIRPDKYDLVYKFTDFDGTTVEIKKPLIVLSPIGDVNISNTADITDASRVLHRFSKDLADNNNVPNYSTGGLLFRYRICDANKDGNINAIDANYIRANKLSQFYTNILEGGGA